jgi:hypothetical protein
MHLHEVGMEDMYDDNETICFYINIKTKIVYFQMDFFEYLSELTEGFRAFFAVFFEACEQLLINYGRIDSDEKESNENT